MLHILIQHAYDTYNDYVLALKGNRGIEWQSPEAYKSFPWGGGVGTWSIYYTCVYMYTLQTGVWYFELCFFFRRLAALQKRRELRAAGIE